MKYVNSRSAGVRKDLRRGSACAKSAARLAKRQACHGFQFGDGLRGIEHLDGSHAQLAGWFQVDPKIIEIDAAFGINTERLGHHFVDTRIGFAKADLSRFDDMIEQRHHLSDVKRSATEAADTVGWEIVGNTAGLEFQFYALESLHHLGSQVS